jgi:hypothetical protein
MNKYTGRTPKSLLEGPTTCNAAYVLLIVCLLLECVSLQDSGENAFDMDLCGSADFLSN